MNEADTDGRPAVVADAAEGIRVDGYRKVYRETLAVDDLSFEVAPGSVLGLAGPNGAGKTTTLRAICGILAPTAGTLTVAGHDVRADPIAAKKKLAYIPDDPKLFEGLNVWEHLQFAASVYDVPDWQPRGDELLAEFALADKKRALAGELSRGMRQKLAICMAYLHRPPALLFDEPLTGLDPRAIRTLKESIKRAAADGAAVIVSSHLLSLVEDLCSHLLILVKGRKRFDGTVAQVRERFAGPDGTVTLEDVFFRATEAEDEDAAAGPGAGEPRPQEPLPQEEAHPSRAGGNPG